MKKQLLKGTHSLTRVLLLLTLLITGVGMSWAEDVPYTVGATDCTTAYLGAKSDAYAINSNGKWTISFTNHNSGSGSIWNNFLVELNNGKNDEFVLRADSWELVRGANTNIERSGYTWVSDAQFVTDMNGAAVAMTVTRNGNEISVASTITPSNGTAAFTYNYKYTMASGNLNLYLSVEEAYLTITKAEWAASEGTVTATEVVNNTFEDNTNLLFTANNSGISQATDATLSSNVLKFSNGKVGTSAAVPDVHARYDFSELVTNASAVKVEFDWNFTNSAAMYGDYLSLGDAANRGENDGGTYNNAGVAFNIAHLRGKYNGITTNQDWFAVNSVAPYYLADGTTAHTYNNYLGTWLHVVAYIDNVTKKVSYIIRNQARTETYFKGYDVDFLNSSATTCSLIEIYHASKTAGSSYMDNLVVTKYENSNKTTYTINYKDADGKPLKESTTTNVMVDDTFTASDDDKASFYTSDNTKYCVYASGNETKTAVAIAANNVINLVFNTTANDSYTVNYVDANGTPIKDATTTDRALHGATIADLISNYNATFMDEATYADATKKYVYTSYTAKNASDEAITEMESGAVITLTFNTLTKCDYNVKGYNNVELGSGSIFEGEEVYVPYNKYVLVGDVLYQASGKQGTENTTYNYGYRVVANHTTSDYTVSYRKTSDAPENVIYYAEFEDLTGATKYQGNGCNKQVSGTYQGCIAGDAIKVITLEAGTYKLTIQALGRSDRYYHIYGGTADNELFPGTDGKGIAFGGWYSGDDVKTLTLTESTDILIKGGENTISSNGSALDYIYIQKMPTITKTSSANLQGFKTFYNANCNYQVDDNTTIYTAATPDDNKVVITKQETDKVIPAGTPVIIKTTASDYNITLTPTTASSSYDYTSNALKAASTKGTIDNAYIMAYTTANKFGFYKYTGSFAVGDVYLPASAGAKLSIVFSDDEMATAINSVDGVYTELSRSGKYFQNGKLVIVKNGKTYNAAGQQMK